MDVSSVSYRTSLYWDFFILLSKDTAECKLCGKKLQYLGQVSNLTRHVNNVHPEQKPQVNVAQNSSVSFLKPPVNDMARLRRENYIKSLEILNMERALAIPYSRYSQEARDIEEASSSTDYEDDNDISFKYSEDIYRMESDEFESVDENEDSKDSTYVP